MAVSFLHIIYPNGPSFVLPVRDIIDAMKVAISGKGGVGKTTLAGVMARLLADRGLKVLAIDADPDSNLASALGFSEEGLRRIRPLAQLKGLVEERTGSKGGTYGAFFKLNPKVDDIPDRFAVEEHGVKLVVLGTIPQGGGGCFCPENVLLKSLLNHILLERDEYVIVDMEAGLEHMGRGSVKHIDGLICVVEPGRRSIHTAMEIRRLALDLGIERLFVVGNKVREDGERMFLRENLRDFEIIGFLSYSEKVLEADRLGISPYDADRGLRKEVEDILERLRR